MVSSYIQFEDVDTKESLINNDAINIDGDHEISYKEAAAYNTSPATITIAGESFKEFQYFTGIGVGKIIGQNLKIIYIPITFTGNSQISPFVSCPLLETLGIFGTIDLHNASPFGNSWVLKNVIVFGQPSDIVKSYVGNLGWFGATSHNQGKFYNKNNQEINAITIEDNNFAIAQGILMKCKSINTIHGNSKLVTINNRAFENSVLSFIDGLDNLTSIGMNAFSGTLLTTFIADNVTNIISGSFGNCTNLETVSLSKVTVLSPSTVSDHGAFSGCTNLVNVNIPNLTTIGSKSFQNCSNLVTLSSTSITSVAERAFYNCVKLETLNTSNITTIGDLAFTHCSEFDSKNFNNVTSIGIGSFMDSGITEVEFKNANFTTTPSDTDTSQNKGVFRDCSELTKIDAPNLINIGKHTFYNCTELVNANIGWNSVTNIKDGAFENCSKLSLNDWTVPDSLTELGGSAFASSNITGSVTIPSTSNLTTLGNGCFRNTKITSFDLQNPNITVLNGRMFDECQELTSINIPYIVTAYEYSLGSSNVAKKHKYNVTINAPSLTKLIASACSYGKGTLYADNLEEVGDGCFYTSNIMLYIKINKLKKIGITAHMSIRSEVVTYNDNSVDFSSLIEISAQSIKDYPMSYAIFSNETFPENQTIVKYKSASGNYLSPFIRPQGAAFTTIYVPDSLLSLYLADADWTRMCTNTGIQIKGISELSS